MSSPPSSSLPPSSSSSPLSPSPPPLSLSSPPSSSSSHPFQRDIDEGEEPASLTSQPESFLTPADGGRPENNKSSTVPLKKKFDLPTGALHQLRITDVAAWPPKKNATLLGIPCELRDEIYRNLLVID